MDKTILEVLNKLENNGFEAYIVGGYVRDYLLNNYSCDIDISTNALPKDLITLFKTYNLNNSNYGSFKIVTDKYNFDITTYRKEISYSNRRPTKIKYINNLLEDLNRRDFTINTLCMNKNGEIIDLLDAKKDIKNKLIKCVGNIDEKLNEDPLRIIRAIRFASILDFNIEEKLKDKIKTYKHLVNTLSLNRIKSELDKILMNNNALNGLKLCEDFQILEELNISYDNLIYVNDLLGMYSQINVPEDYPFTKSEKSSISNIKSIIKTKEITNKTLYDYGLYICLVAGSILNISHKEINEMYNSLAIKSMNEIDIETKEICKILNVEPSNILQIIKDDLVEQIINNRLINKKSDIINYIITNQRKWLNEGNPK